jgi:hypothetical protein
MQRTILSGILALAMMFCFWFYGCGDTDLLDELNQRYTASMSIEDAGDSTMTIDVVQNLDCDGAANTTDPEFFTDVFANITISIESGAPGLTLEGYTIDFIPLRSDNDSGTYYLPPDIPDVDDPGSNTFSISSGSSGTFTTTCMTLSAKGGYLALIAADPNFNQGDYIRYTIRFTLFFIDEYDNDRVIEVERTIELGNYDNC